ALEIERLVGPNFRGHSTFHAQPACDPCARRNRAVVMRIDVVDVHADVLARDTGTLRTDRAVSALRADPDPTVAELDGRMDDHSLLAHESRGRDLAEPERALQERQRGADV